MNLLDMQQEIKTMLEKSYQAGRLSHAYIFYGEEGVGKSEMALYLSALMYSNGNVDFTSPTTKQIFDHRFPNVFEVYPKKNEIVKESINEMMEEFSKTSLVDGPRIYIVHEADRLNVKTSNMLLKFIEEPSNDIHGIFITTHLSNILPTIISRCNLIRFKSMDKATLKDMILESGTALKDAELASLLTNNYDQAMKIIDSDEFITGMEFANTIMSKKEVETLLYLKDNQEIYSGIENLKFVLNILSIYLEDSLSISYYKISSNEELYKSFNAKNKIDDVENKLALVLEYIKMCDSNVAPRNVIYNLVAKWYR